MKQGDVAGDRRAVWWAWAVGGLVWLLVCRNLAVHWSANPTYSYGWLVPALGLYAAFARWKRRPAPGRPWALGSWLTAFAALAFFPTWIFAQPNPDWSLVGWVMTAEVVALTFGLVAGAGGGVWVRHFAFPICFIFVAVPCPRVLEVPLTQGLMREIAGLTADLLNLAGIAAVQHGSVIEVKSGLLGVDEACSGVRSLQASLMASLFLGELFRFPVFRRVLLLLIGLATALATNLARTFFLSWSAARSGLSSVDQWHDPAGFTILTVCFLLVWLVALFWGRHDPLPAPAREVPAARPLPTSLLAGLTVWIALTLAVTEAWYYDGAEPPRSAWTAVPPTDATAIDLGRNALEQLQCDRSTAAEWQQDDGGNWLLYFLEWRPGPMRSRVLARVHRPETCLSSIGLKLVADRGLRQVEVAGQSLAFRAYTFDQGGQQLFVYYGLWQNRGKRSQAAGALSESEHVASFQAVRWRERHLGQQVAELAATGYLDAEEADAAFAQMARKIIVPRDPPPEAQLLAPAEEAHRPRGL